MALVDLVHQDLVLVLKLEKLPKATYERNKKVTLSSRDLLLN